MDKDFSHLMLRNSFRRNSKIGLETMKLLYCQAKAVVNCDELRENEELFKYSEMIITKFGPVKNLLETMSEEL